MPDGEPKPFVCRCGSILGLIVRGNDHRSRLWAFRDTLQAGDWNGMISDYRFRMRNVEQGEIECDYCRASTPWVASERALVELLARRKKRTFGLEVEHG